MKCGEAPGGHVEGSITTTSEADMSEDKSRRGGKGKGKLPGTYKAFIRKFPALGDAHESVAKAVDEAGPLDAKTCALIKMGICVGAGLESALRSHVRRATQHGATVEEIEQAVLLAMNTCGLPRTVAAWQWAWTQIQRDRDENR